MKKISGVHIIEVLHVIDEKNTKFILKNRSLNLFNVYQDWLKQNDFNKRFGKRYTNLKKHINDKKVVNYIAQNGLRFIEYDDEIDFNNQLNKNKNVFDIQKVISLYIKPLERNFF